VTVRLSQSCENDEVQNESHIPLVDLSIQHRRVWPEIQSVWADVLEATSFVLGPAVRAFEGEFAAFTQIRHCVGVANGGDAVELALRSLGVGTGDEVIIPANTFTATAMAVQRIGARPVAIDVDPSTFLIRADLIESALSARSKAVIPVHLFGQLAPMVEVASVARQHGLAIVEDAAQCQGAKNEEFGIGVLSDAVATSFYPGKNLGAYGDGGAVLTNRDDIAQRVRSLRNYGGTVKYQHDEFGYNSRLDSLQAAVLSVKLRYLDGWNAERAVIANLYEERLASIDFVRTPVVAEGNTHVWHLYVIQIPNRDAVLRYLNHHGVGAGIHYPQTIMQQPAFSSFRSTNPETKTSDSLANKILSLPIFPGMSEYQVDQVVALLKKALAEAT
jgi:dTDP-4-amino-4,6-dideoxygalactose transaminase